MFQGGAYLHQFHLHGHVDGEEHVDGVRLPQDQGVLPREAWAGVPGSDKVERLALEHFQVVDMRWGVRDEMTDEHMTTVSTN